MVISLFKNVHFPLERNKQPAITNVHSTDARAILDSVVNPNGSWVLKIKFDECALSKKDKYDTFYCKIRETFSADQKVQYFKNYNVNEYPSHGSDECIELKIIRMEFFEPSATLRDVLTRVTNGKCFGYFKGLQQIDTNCYKLLWRGPDF